MKIDKPKFLSEKRKKLVGDYYSNKIKNVELFVDNVWDPHNVAALSRTADALGIEKINLYYTYNKFPDFSRVGKKSSSSATKWIKFDKIKDLELFVREKKKEGFVFLGADFSERAFRLDEFEFPEKCILVLGSESDGLSEEVKKVCDKFIFVPMVGMVESLNVSVAGGILMHELFRQKGKELKLRGRK
jgi:tRNA (guanosine-2'-O-)-methyltransferase